MECMIEMLKQRSSDKICDEGHLDALTDDVYNICFQEYIYENRNENETSQNIRYGNVAPKTTEGRLFVIAYGVLGIPFTMLAIASLGKFLAEILKGITQITARAIKAIFCCSSMQKQFKEKEALISDSKNDNKKQIIPTDDIISDNTEVKKVQKWGEALVLIVAFFIYIIIGSIAIASYEPEMDFFGAIYFNFVSLTTIGLGDLVPKK
uniref:Ion_trans_2 domain-containing protein n=1 Tax=Loa loa TaxID=7209 RepID=A0A1I7VC40_LOALO